MSTIFHQISWLSYTAFIGTALIAYYVIIGVKFYSDELHLLFSNKRPNSNRTSKDSAPFDTIVASQSNESEKDLSRFNNDALYQPAERDTTFDRLQELAENLKDVILEAVANNYNKEELTSSLRNLIKKYNFLRNSSYGVSINNLIVSECEKYSFTQLSVDEIRTLWED